MTSTSATATPTGPEQDVLLVRVVGDLDMATTGRFLDDASGRLGDEPLRRVEVDMSQAAFVDSTGLAALVDLRRTAHALGAETKLVDVGRQTTRLLRIVGLDGIFLDDDGSAASTPR